MSGSGDKDRGDGAGDGADHPDDRALRNALVGLTVVTGVLDAVSFLGLGGVFTAFMTGNVLFLGFAVAGGSTAVAGSPGLAPAASLTALVSFLAGAAGGDRLWIALGGQRRKAFLVVALIVSTLLAVAGLLALRLDDAGSTVGVAHYPVIALMAFAMGVRTANVQRLGYGLTTTLITGTLITVVGDSPLGGGGRGAQPYRLLTVAAVFAGGAIGALLLRFGMALPLFVAAVGVIGIVAGYFVHRSRG